MVIVDTNVLSEAMRPRPDERVIAWMDAQAIETLYLSAITLAELRFGIAMLPEGRRRETMSLRLEEDVLTAFAGRILPFDDDASRSYASLMAQARRSGTAIGQADGYIAATAISHGFSVATRDSSPFEAAGIAVVNPSLGID